MSKGLDRAPFYENIATLVFVKRHSFCNSSSKEAVGMNKEFLLAFIPICISAVALVFSLFCILINRINVSSEYRNKILDWYGKCISVIMRLKHCTLENNEKKLMLGELSGLIEYGRFFFPNIKKNDGFGEKKPAAYQGYRSHVLEHLVHYYDLFNAPGDDKPKKAREIQMKFTSAVYDYLKPWKFIRRLDIVLRESYRNDYPIEDEEKNVL